MKKKGIYRNYIKRLFDIVCALLALIVFCWLYAIVAILVRVKLGSPIIFHQERPGMIDPKTGKENIFKLCKFRSMSDARDENGELLPDSMRLTKFGKILRATSMDELPEAINILRGDMSVVGPRPLLVKYLEHYTEFEHNRHSVRPGLTGLAQVSGRNVLTWKARFERDNEYVENVSFFGDIKIILLTLKKVFIHEGIEYKSNETFMDYIESKKVEK
jgi:lipopolysaccharide/colanic/teichoic acid biosynthesis glycosyltransferase